jgi:hypothetical protein
MENRRKFAEFAKIKVRIIVPYFAKPMAWLRVERLGNEQLLADILRGSGILSA